MTWGQTSSLDQPDHGGFTAEEQKKLRKILPKGLGPEWLSQRSGPGGRLTYIEGKTAINLANDLFGFNGWSSELRNCSVDFIDVSENGRVNLGISTTVRVTLRDGTFHEDVGYGSAENSRNKAAAFEKAKKEAATDGLKRALRMFGNALGNCIYDKTFLSSIGRMSHPTIKFTPDNLHRHKQFAREPTDYPLANGSNNSKAESDAPPPPQSSYAPTLVATPQKSQKEQQPQSSTCKNNGRPRLVTEDSFSFDDDIEDTALIEMAEVHDKADIELPIEPMAIKRDPESIDVDEIPVSNFLPTHGRSCLHSINFPTQTVSIPDHTAKRQRQ